MYKVSYKKRNDYFSPIVNDYQLESLKNSERCGSIENLTIISVNTCGMWVNYDKYNPSMIYGVF